MPRVFIVDDDAPILEWLDTVVRTVGLETSPFSDPREFLATYRRDDAEPACAVFDMRMPRFSGLALLEHLRASGDPLPVILLSAHADVTSAVEAMKLGATDFLQKPARTQAVIDAVNSAMELAERTSEAALVDRELCAAFDTLTAKERQILDGILDGKANKVMAIDLDITEKAVETRRARLMRKLDATSVAEVVQLALRVQGQDPSR